MYKIYAISFVVILSFSFASMRVEKNDPMGRLRFNTGKLYPLSDDPETSVRYYLKGLEDRIGLEHAHMLPLVYYKLGKNKTGHFSFQQILDGIPVFGRYIHIHTNKNIITSISSNIETIGLSILPLFTKEEAIDIIRPYHISTSTYLKYQKIQIYIYNGHQHLTHTVDAINFENPWRYMIDAHTGEIIDRFPLLFEEGPVIGSGINLLSEAVDTLYVYDGNDFAPIGEDLVTPYLLCEEFCFDYGDCGGDSYSDCVVYPQQGDCEEGYLLDCNGECFNSW